MHEVSTSNKSGSLLCGSLGGDIYLIKGKEIPRCKECSKEMSLYLQIDIKSEFDVPFIPGSKLNVFCCPDHDGIPDEQYSDLDKEVQMTYCNEHHGHYSMMLVLPEELSVEPIRKEGVILEKPLFGTEEEKIRECEYLGTTSENYGFKIGGTPSWLNYTVDLNCTCGAEIKYLCQLPDGYDFFFGEGPADYHTLFLSNQIVFMACERQCSPYAVIAVCDN